jgi:hypothetical protein
MGQDEAFAELERRRGTHFDSDDRDRAGAPFDSDDRDRAGAPWRGDARGDSRSSGAGRRG